MGTTVLLVIAALVLAGSLAGALLGYRGVAIKSGSMTPTIGVGSLVVSRSVSPLALHRGDIVTFRDPALHEELVTHRIVHMQATRGRVDFVTKGDANTATEHWNVPVSGHLGREVFVVPALGRWMSSAGSKQGRVLEIGLATLMLAYVALRWIWREPHRVPELSTS